MYKFGTKNANLVFKRINFFKIKGGKSMLKKSTSGFTLIEMAVVFAIIAIAASLATVSMIRMMPRIKVRGDAWDVHQALLSAKMQAVGENTNIGVIFFHRGYKNDPRCLNADCYVIFKDADGDNKYTDTDGNFLKFTPGEDPLIGAVRRINTNNTFWRVFGIYLSNPGDYVWLIFNSLGNVEWFGSSTNPNNPMPFSGGTIEIFTRNPIKEASNLYYMSGVMVQPVGGNLSVVPPKLEHR